MAGICFPNPSFTSPVPTLNKLCNSCPLLCRIPEFTNPSNLQRINGVRCCLGTPSDENRSRIETNKGAKTPQILKLAVSGVTELLRAFSNGNSVDNVKYEGRAEVSASSVDDVMMILKADYENAYFVTGILTSSIYTEDCLFEDPTIRFRGTELYLRNLKLLVPFFESPSIGLQNIEKGVDSGTNFLLATWKLRTYLKFPWKPFISIDGSTTYELNEEFKVVRHTESWNVSAIEAVAQIFAPSFRRTESDDPN